MIRQFLKDQLKTQAKKRLVPSYIRLHRKAHAIGRAISSPDPWAVLSLVGFRNFERIKHDPVNLGTTTIPAYSPTGEYGPTGERVEATIVRVITDGMGRFAVPAHLHTQLMYRVDRHSLDMDAEPLGPEDYELGVRVEPHKPWTSLPDELYDIWQSAPDLRKKNP